MFPIIDGHLDLAYNALAYDRDETLPVSALRRREAGMKEPDRGEATVSLPQMRQGGVGLCVASLIARWRDGPNRGTPLRTSLDCPCQDAAYAAARGQIAYYELLEHRREVRIIRDKASLAEHWSNWLTAMARSATSAAAPAAAPIGVVLAMECADPVLSPAQLQHWWDLGLRSIMPAHYGPSAYAHGTGGSGPLTPAGRELLKTMTRLGVTLDVSHLCDASFFEAMDLHDGPVVASHSNCRALARGERQISDEQIRLLVQRGAVIGAALYDAMLVDGFVAGQTPRQAVRLELVANHIDHVCQLAGSARHAAIGSDLDGGFGASRGPMEIDTIADLPKLASLLSAKGYADADIAAIFHGNWLRWLEGAVERRGEAPAERG